MCILKSAMPMLKILILIIKHGKGLIGRVDPVSKWLPRCIFYNLHVHTSYKQVHWVTQDLTSRVSFRGAFAPLDYYLPPLGNLKLIPTDKGCVNYNCNTVHKTVQKYNYMSHNNPSMLPIPYVYDIF